jgi:uncharacterized protein YbjT (DUF2867 family)
MILVIGGTRGTGKIIVDLLERTGAAVRVLARNPDEARNQFPAANVEVVGGDITKSQSLPAGVAGASHIIFTAGCRSGHPVGERKIIATEYEGLRNTLHAASSAGFRGRFLYMTASGVHLRSFWTLSLNLYKGNTLVWRRRAEDEIRGSGLQYTIIRTGMLVNRAAGRHGIRLTQEGLPLSPFYRIARADVAEAFVAALDHPHAIRTTFEIVRDRSAPRQNWVALLDGLKSDFSRAVPSSL